MDGWKWIQTINTPMLKLSYTVMWFQID
jgi:hypothetical protein